MEENWKGKRIATYFIPEGIDVDALIKDYPPPFEFKEYKLLYILHMINARLPIDSKVYPKSRGFVAINQKKLKAKGIKNAARYLEWLMDLRIIKCDRSYIEGKKSLGYRFTTKYNKPVRPVIIERRSGITQAERAKKLASKHDQLEYKSLAKNFNEKLTIDDEGAIEYLKLQFKATRCNNIMKAINKYRNDYKDIPYERYTEIDLKGAHELQKQYIEADLINGENTAAQKYKDLYLWLIKIKKINIDELRENHRNKTLRTNIDTYINAATKSYNHGWITIWKIKNQRFSFSIDHTSKRLFTVIVTCKREVRNYIKYDGRTLYSCDYKNSQAFIGGALLKLKFWQRIKQPEVKPIEREFDYSMIAKGRSRLPNDLPSSVTFTKEEESAPDVTAYLKKVQEGEIYDYLQDEVETKGIKMFNENQSPKSKRQKLKKMFFAVIFSSNRYINHAGAKPKRIFKDIFETVYNIFAMVKNKDHRILPILLQSIEGELILNRIVKRIAREKKGKKLIIFTIHDSIVSTDDDLDYILKVMKEETVKAIGIKPVIEPEELNPNEIDWKQIKKDSNQIKWNHKIYTPTFS
jgi:hypothetical protein